MNRDHEVRTHAEPYREDKIHLDADPQRFMPRNRTAPMKLPLDFKPTPYSVIVGRGKLISESVGNRRLRVLATTFMQKYSQASSKIEKTTTVSRIVEIIQEACPFGAFIKLDDGRWWEVDDHTAREKVGYIIRDLLGDKYRSSSKSKVVARRRSSGVSPRREDSSTPPVPSPAKRKKEQGGNKDRRKSHLRRHYSASLQEGPTTSMTKNTAPRPPYNTEQKEDLVLGVYGSSWPRNDLGGLEHTKKYVKKNPPKSIQSGNLKKNSSKAREDHLLVLAGAAAEMTDFSSLSSTPLERNAYARAAPRSPNPASTLPTSGNLDGKYSVDNMFLRTASQSPIQVNVLVRSSGDLNGNYSADNMFPNAAARNRTQANALPRSSGDLDGQYSRRSSTKLFTRRSAAPSHNEPNIPLRSSGNLDGNYSGGLMFARAAHSPSRASTLPCSGDLDQRYSADNMFVHAAARSPNPRTSLFPSSGDLDGNYPAERQVYGSNHSPGGAVLAPDEELGGSKNLINDNFLSFLDQHMPSPLPLHTGALLRPVDQANEDASTRIGGDPMLRNSLYREFDSRARNDYPGQEFLRQPPVFNSFNSERLEFRRRKEPTPMEHGRSLEDACNYLLNQPNLRNPWPSSSQTRGRDEYYEDISHVSD